MRFFKLNYFVCFSSCNYQISLSAQKCCETQKEIRIQLNTDDIADVNVDSIFEEIQNQLNDDELDKIRSMLEDAKVKLDNVIADITNGLEDIEIDVQVEVESN